MINQPRSPALRGFFGVQTMKPMDKNEMILDQAVAIAYILAEEKASLILKTQSDSPRDTAQRIMQVYRLADKIRDAVIELENS